MNGKRSERNCGHKQNGKLGSCYILLSISDMTRKPSRWSIKNKAKNEIEAKKAAPGVSPRGPRRTQMPLVGQRRPALPRTDSAVPSALGGLTSGFGMGPGVPPPPWPLTNEGHSVFRGPRRGVPWGPHSMQARRHNRPHRPRPRRDGRARPISAARLRRSRALHLRPIDLVVYQGPYRREDSSRDWLPA